MSVETVSIGSSKSSVGYAPTRPINVDIEKLPRTRSFCSMPQVAPRVFDRSVGRAREMLIRMNADKWVNGTVLHYYFFNGPEAEKQIVRQAFAKWKDLGIGLSFVEVSSRTEAEIRIGFVKDGRAWSYLGRQVLDYGADEQTMNFGWDLTDPGEMDTAIHEIGHTLGFPHEHQNPNAGIEWNEEAVYAALAQPPNGWDRQTTYWNIIRKIQPDSVQGSNWDPDSIMHYPFGANLILKPVTYQNGLRPAGGLSARDKEWVRTFYPPLAPADHVELKPFVSQPLTLAPAQQANFIFRPTATRHYEFRTFGASDTVMVLFEDDNGNPRYLAGDDDSGEDRNAYLKEKLLAGRTYLIRIRLYYANVGGDTAVMVW